MNKFAILYHILLSLFFISLNAQPGGHLIIIGGGDKPDPVIERIIELAGGPDAKIIVIPNASSEPVESAEYQVNQFRSFGSRNVEAISFSKQTANDDSVVSRINEADGIFFCGGDQSKLTADLLDTRLLERIREIYYNGGVISGTSAGAAVMSEVMITGNELVNKDSSTAFNVIEKGNIQTTKGFGFITKAVIDQHFIKRKRNNRLISVVLEHPDLLGIGIDESTAIQVNPDDTFEVLGESQVIIYNPLNAKDIRLNQDRKFSVSNMGMDILVNGQKFDMNKKHVIE
jgi:cyanophycinase